MAPRIKNISGINIRRSNRDYDSYQNAIIDLKNGRSDGVFGDTAVVNEWLAGEIATGSGNREK